MSVAIEVIADVITGFLVVATVYVGGVIIIDDLADTAVISRRKVRRERRKEAERLAHLNPSLVFQAEDGR